MSFHLGRGSGARRRRRFLPTSTREYTTCHSSPRPHPAGRTRRGINPGRQSYPTCRPLLGTGRAKRPSRPQRPLVGWAPESRPEHPPPGERREAAVRRHLKVSLCSPAAALELDLSRNPTRGPKRPDTRRRGRLPRGARGCKVRPEAPSGRPAPSANVDPSLRSNGRPGRSRPAPDGARSQGASLHDLWGDVREPAQWSSAV